MFVCPISLFLHRKEFFEVNFASESNRIFLLVRKAGPHHHGSPYTHWFFDNFTPIKLSNVNLSLTPDSR